MKKRRVLTLVASTCLTLALVTLTFLSACGPAEPEEPTAPTTPTAPAEEGPKYGGTIRVGQPTKLRGFDTAMGYNTDYIANNLTKDELVIGDWSKGSQGTGEASFRISGTLFPRFTAGNLAESWEMPDDQTCIFHLREGVHFHDKPPVNGREMTADDVAYSFNRLFTTETCYHYNAILPSFESVTATDKYTVTFKSAPGKIGHLFWWTADWGRVIAHEVVEEYGDYRDWHNQIGTGPYMIKDYVPDSYITFERNPNFWGYDPNHPENRLPYLDEVIWVIMPDEAARLAAFRTAQIDWVNKVGWEDAGDITRRNPDIQEFRFLEAAHMNVIYMKMEEGQPFTDIRVRRAMSMALNQEEIKDKFYGGNAELLSCPVAPYPELYNLYTELEDQSQSVQELYQYLPDKARQLLADAGYPNGFKTKLLLTAKAVPLCSLLADYWANVGVDVELDVKEQGVYNSMKAERTHEAMIWSVMSTVAPGQFRPFRPTDWQDASLVDDPRVNAAYEEIAANLIVKQEDADEAMHEIFPYCLEQAWFVEPPSPYLWTLWWPWLKGYGGEYTVGQSNGDIWARWVWMDEDLKVSMGH